MINFDNIHITEILEFNGGEGVIKGKIFQDENVKIMKAVLESGTSIGKHTHEASSEIIYVISGIAKCTLNGKEENIKSGECHYCPKGSTHFVKNEEKEDLVILCVVPNQ